MAGAATFGIGSVFGGTGSLLNEVCRGVAHGMVQGGMSAMQGGDFWSGFASGALGSLVGHGAEALRLTNTTASTLAFSTIAGGIGSAAMGGNFWQGAANGLMVGLLNQVQHKVESEQQEKRFQEVLEKFNNIVKDANDLVSLPIELAKQFTPDELKMLRQAGKISWYVGAITVGVDVYLAWDAYSNGDTWGWHAYDAAIGAVGMMGTPGAIIATATDGTVNGARFFSNVYYQTNAKINQMIINKLTF